MKSILSFVVGLILTSAVFAADSAQKLYLEASKAERDGNTSKAMSLYEKITTKFPDNPLAIKAADKLTEQKNALDKDAASSKDKQEAARQRENDASQAAQQRAQDRMRAEAENCRNRKFQCQQNCARYPSYSDSYMMCKAGCEPAFTDPCTIYR